MVVLVKKIILTTQFFKADFFIFPVSVAPSNIGITISTSSFLKNLNKSSSSMYLTLIPKEH